MFNVIENLYYGNHEPMEMSSEYAPGLKKQLSKLTAIEEILYEKLTDEDRHKKASTFLVYSFIF